MKKMELSKMYTLGKTSKEQLLTVNPVLQTLVNRTITGSTQDFGIIKGGGFRTAEEQHKLYLEEKTKCDGYKNKSYHQSGTPLTPSRFLKWYILGNMLNSR